MRRYTLINEAVRQRAIEAVRAAAIGSVVMVRDGDAKQRTNPQNNLYWEWIDRIRLHVGDSTGQWYSKDQMHEYFKAKFQPTDEVSINGESRFVTKSTTKNDVKEMSEYMDKVSSYCASSLCLYLPSPEFPNA